MADLAQDPRNTAAPTTDPITTGTTLFRPERASNVAHGWIATTHARRPLTGTPRRLAVLLADKASYASPARDDWAMDFLQAGEVAAWPGIRFLAAHLECAEITVKRAIRKLAERGLERRRTGGTNIYIFPSTRRRQPDWAEIGQPRPAPEQLKQHVDSQQVQRAQQFTHRSDTSDATPRDTSRRHLGDTSGDTSPTSSDPRTDPRTEDPRERSTTTRARAREFGPLCATGRQVDYGLSLAVERHKITPETAETLRPRWARLTGPEITAVIGDLRDGTPPTNERGRQRLAALCDDRNPAATSPATSPRTKKNPARARRQRLPLTGSAQDAARQALVTDIATLEQALPLPERLPRRCTVEATARLKALKARLAAMPPAAPATFGASGR